LRSRDPDQALAAVGGAVTDWEGGTRIGESLKQLLDEWSTRSALRGSVDGNEGAGGLTPRAYVAKVHGGHFKTLVASGRYQRALAGVSSARTKWQVRLPVSLSAPQLPLPGLTNPVRFGGSKPAAKSLVVVLPQLPVMPTKGMPFNAALRSRAVRTSVSLTTEVASVPIRIAFPRQAGGSHAAA
jgi:hypothetical protein